MELGVFMSEVVKKFYDENSEEEWRRLFQDAYHRLEFLVTMHFLDKYLPRSGLILDAGGGPGRYSIELAKKGYDVVLVDISPKCLEIAKREIKSANVEES
jgi:2-polyprenyl-3-methyl-5-hydroxy-6-metoxy-1,4-benzoquinol methylase